MNERQGGGKMVDRHPEGYLVCPRNHDGMELCKLNPNALVLLYVIAMRAWRGGGFNGYGLEPGQALIGDFKEFGLTRQQYRTALRQLEKHGFVTIKATTDGTIVTLCNTRVFDINVNS